MPTTWFLWKTIICSHLDQPHHLLCSGPTSRQRLYMEVSCLLAASVEEEMKHWHREWLGSSFSSWTVRLAEAKCIGFLLRNSEAIQQPIKGPAITHFPRSGCLPAAVCLWIYLRLPSNSDFLCAVSSVTRRNIEIFPFCHPFLWI